MQHLKMLCTQVGQLLPLSIVISMLSFVTSVDSHHSSTQLLPEQRSNQPEKKNQSTCIGVQCLLKYSVLSMRDVACSLAHIKLSYYTTVAAPEFYLLNIS